MVINRNTAGSAASEQIYSIFSASTTKSLKAVLGKSLSLFPLQANMYSLLELYLLLRALNITFCVRSTLQRSFIMDRLLGPIFHSQTYYASLLST